MNRLEHQPLEGNIVRTPHSQDEFVRLFEGFCCMILANEVGTTPLKVTFEDEDKAPVLCEPPSGCPSSPRPLQRYEGKACVAYALDAAIKAQIPHIALLVSPMIDSDVRSVCDDVLSENFENSDRKAEVEVVECDDESAFSVSEGMAHFDLYGLDASVLLAAAELARRSGSSACLVMSCDQVRLGPEHLFELASDFRCKPDLDVAASWIYWARRTPMVLSRAFLDSLEGSFMCTAQKSGSRPAPCIDAHDHVFGEERLSANAVLPARVEEFLGDGELVALQAVRIAHMEGSEFEQATEGLCERDLFLVDAASRMVGQARGALSGRELEELEWADAFGHSRRRDFPLLSAREHRDRLVYLDSAATSQRVFPALAAQYEFDTHANANIYRGGYSLSQGATKAYNEARSIVERYIGSETRQVVFAQNTSQAASIAALSWGENNLREGDLVLIGLQEHHSCLLPWAITARRKGAKVEYIPYTSEGRYDLDAYSSLLGHGPRLVAIDHVSNVFGMLNPVSKMGDMARQRGARVFLDAAQSFAHMPLDVGKLGVDFVAFSGHKAYGPFASGGLWISQEAFDEMDPLVAGGGTVSHASKQDYYLRRKCIQYELGTPPVSQAVGFGAACEYILSVGFKDIRRHESALTCYLARGLRAVCGVTVFGDHEATDGRCGLVSFGLYGADSESMGSFFGKLGVCVRAGSHCAIPLAASLGVTGVARASLAVHSTAEDIEALLCVLEAYRLLRK